MRLEPTGPLDAGSGAWLPLHSEGPHPDIADGDRIFDPFIGSWDLEVSWYEDEALTRTLPGEWHFAWVLEGRAIQDVWIVPRRELRTEGKDLYEYGTSLRFPDASIDGWRSTWIGPMQRSVRMFAARRAGPDVVLDSLQPDEEPVRWTLSEVTATSFSWTNATLAGERWVVTQRFAATRAVDLA